ncbi:Amiloride-sensitive cation channel 5 [Chelonia mydas]|uniref:Bile acid-sensitive ion channel n=1 Tax=Chelonia mydas TaxID=8469 RepID=M7AQ57_CHEMY|nr:Amiloride-sensitive cation channel 5 [Chelonia mydas]
MLVVLGSITIVAWQIWNRFTNYFSWPTTTSIVVQYVENIEFPAVTFCNLNRFQAHAVANLSIVFFLWSIVAGVLRAFTIDKFSQELTDFLQGHQNFSIKEFTRNNGFYLNNSTLLECDFFGQPCYPEDFEHVFTEYGNCFTFNHMDLPARRRVSLSGRGLSLLFDIKQAQFTDDPTFGFLDAGIIYVVHSPKEPPRFDGLGLSTPVGMHAHAAISQQKTVIQEYPWGECNPNIKLQHHKIYSTYGCLQECKARHIQDKCGCLPFLLPDNVELMGLCTVGTHNSTCPVPCEETDYPTTVTYSSFVNEKALKFLSTKLKRSPEYVRQWGVECGVGEKRIKTKSPTSQVSALTIGVKVMRENLVYIDIKYHNLNYKMTRQQKARSVSELLADIGGQLGLFCGASMITVIEIVEYVFTNFCWLCIFLLLKAPEMPQWNIPAQNEQTDKKGIQEC